MIIRQENFRELEKKKERKKQIPVILFEDLFIVIGSGLILFFLFCTCFMIKTSIH